MNRYRRPAVLGLSGACALAACVSGGDDTGSGGRGGTATATVTGTTGGTSAGGAAGTGGGASTTPGGSPGGGPGGTGGQSSSGGAGLCVGGFGLTGGSGPTGGAGGHAGGAGARPQGGGGASSSGGYGGTGGAHGGAGGFADGGAGGRGGAIGLGGLGGGGGSAGAPAGGFGGAAGAPGGSDGGGGDGGGGAAPFCCGDELVDSRDGRSYRTVTIGSQCWMAQNLDVGIFVSIATSQTDDGTIEKYCYDDQPANCTPYGGLYQWGEMMAYAPSDAADPSTTRGICPIAWHLPSDAEYQTLEMTLGMTAAEASLINQWRGSDVGAQLKAGGSSGFGAKLSGRCGGGSCFGLGQYEYLATSTEHGSYAWRRCLGYASDEVGRYNTFPKAYALSVRCVLDQP